MSVDLKHLSQTEVQIGFSPQLSKNLEIPKESSVFEKPVIELGLKNLTKMMNGESTTPAEQKFARETVVGMQLASTQKFFTENLEKMEKTHTGPESFKDVIAKDDWKEKWTTQVPSVVAMQKVNIEGKPFMVVTDGSITEGLQSDEARSLVEVLSGKKLEDIQQQLKHQPLNHYPATILVDVPDTKAKLLIQVGSDRHRSSENNTVTVRMVIDGEAGKMLAKSAVDSFVKSK